MKNLINIIAIVFIVLAHPAWAQQDTVFNQKDQNGLRHGEWKEYYPNGQLRYEGQFRHGEPFDVFKYYFQNGKLKSILKYDVEDPKKVEATHYYETGEKMAEGNYWDRKKEGLWKTYGANEVLLSEGSYVGDKKYGVWKVYHRNGQVAMEVFMENDLEQGQMKKYFENGNIQEEAFYKDGFKEGKTIIYTTEGDTSVVGSYYKDTRDGQWRFYNEKKEIEKIIEYDKGKLLTPEAENTEVESMEKYKNNRKDELEFEDLMGPIRYE